MKILITSFITILLLSTWQLRVFGQIDLTMYLWEFPVPQDFSPDQELVAILQAETDKIIQSGDLFYRPIMCRYSDQIYDHFFLYQEPGRILHTLAMAYPYLTTTQQQSVRNMAHALFADAVHQPWAATAPPRSAGKQREWFPYNEIWGEDSDFGLYRPAIQSVYSIWLYFYTTSDTIGIAPYYEQIKSFYTNKVNTGIDPGNLYGTMGAHIGMARLAHVFNDQQQISFATNRLDNALENGLDIHYVDSMAFYGLQGWNAPYAPEYHERRDNWIYRGQIFLGLTPEIGRYLKNELFEAIAERHQWALSRFPLWWIRQSPYFTRWTGDEGVGIPSEIFGMIMPIEKWVMNQHFEQMKAVMQSAPLADADAYWLESLVLAIESDATAQWTDVRTTTYDTEIQLDLPFVSTDGINTITADGATLSGTILTQGNSAVHTAGIVFATHDTPTTNDGFVLSLELSGNFSAVLSDLLSNTDYFARAFATNEAGTSYGETISFTTITPEQCNPGWTVAESLPYSMQLVAQFAGASSNDRYILGAFDGNECRGIAYQHADNPELFTLTIQSDQITNTPISLRIWDNNLCSDCEAFPAINFEHQANLGSIENPFQIACGINKSMEIQQGYSWISLNIEAADIPLNNLLSSLDPCIDDRLIGQNEFAVFTGNEWVGSLQSILTNSSYVMRLCSSQTMQVFGQAAVLQPIALQSGFTWLGYHPQYCLPLSQAMAGLSPGPAYDDRLIGQTSFALFNGTNWVGSLDQLCPDEGYVIKLNSPQTLLYPEALTGHQKRVRHPAKPPFANELPQNKQHSMMVVARILTADGQFLNDPEAMLLAFTGDTLSGMALPLQNENGLYLLSIGANASNHALLRFASWKNDELINLNANEPIHFEAFKSIGHYHEPFVFSESTTSIPKDESNPAIQFWGLFPNPAKDHAILSFVTSTAVALHLQLYGSNGSLIQQIHKKYPIAGKMDHLIHLNDLPAGMVVVNAILLSQTGAVQQSFRLIIQ